MSAIQFLAEWTLRSSILILSGGLLLLIFRIKDSSIRLAAWTAMLCGSLALPLLNVALPKMTLALPRVSDDTRSAAAGGSSSGGRPGRADTGSCISSG